MLKKLFRKKRKLRSFDIREKNANVNWINLESLNQLEEIEVESKSKPVLIFKHSTRCVISKTVMSRFEELFPKGINIKTYYLDLLNYRDISNKISSKFEVAHQSPQVLIIEDGNVIQHASHYDITQINFNRFINK